MTAMDDPELVKAITRIETKLDNFTTTQTDHETRIRDLEKNDLGRIVPFLIGLAALAAFGLQLYSSVSHSASDHSMDRIVSVQSDRH